MISAPVFIAYPCLSASLAPLSPQKREALHLGGPLCEYSTVKSLGLQPPSRTHGAHGHEHEAKYEACHD